jgi:transcriptional regulator with XRE-family HTH domain
VAARSKAHAALGEAIRHVRRRRGLSQDELASISEVHRTYLGGVERGERNPSYANLRKIAGALKVDLSEIVLGAEAVERGESPADEEGTESPQD